MEEELLGGSPDDDDISPKRSEKEVYPCSKATMDIYEDANAVIESG